MWRQPYAIVRIRKRYCVLINTREKSNAKYPHFTKRFSEFSTEGIGTLSLKVLSIPMGDVCEALTRQTEFL